MMTYGGKGHVLTMVQFVGSANVVVHIYGPICYQYSQV